MCTLCVLRYAKAAKLIDGHGHEYFCNVRGLTVKWMDKLYRIIGYGRKYSKLKLASSVSCTHTLMFDCLLSF